MAIVILTFTTPGGKYVYDRETNSLLSVADDEFPAFQRVQEGTACEDDWVLLKRYTDNGYLKETCLTEIQHSMTPHMRHKLENQISHLTLQLSQRCNLRCSYCAFGSNNYENQRTHASQSMPLEVIKKSVDFLMARSHGVGEVALGFYGGEPLLEIENFVACVEYTKEAYKGRPVAYNITTNGTMLDDDILRFIDENKINIAISFDGPKHLHDKNRVFADGSGSYDKIIANVMYIKENYPDLYRRLNFITIVAPGVDYSCINDFYTADEVLRESAVMSNSVSPFGAKEELLQYDDQYQVPFKFQMVKVLLAEIGLYSQDKVSRLFSPKFASVITTYKGLSKYSIRNKSHPGGPCLPGVMRPFVNVYGNIFPCERVSEESDAMRIGHIDTGFEMDKVEAMLNVGKLTEAECIACWNFIHCVLCVAACDGGTELSSEKRLKECVSAKGDTWENIKTICWLLENGYDFGD